jgi:uncharacterized OB-fold protein
MTDRPAAPPVLPTISEANRPFWEGCLAGELRLQVCDACGHVRYPISDICPRCLSPRTHWAAMSGRGQILSWVRFRHAYNPAWADQVPYKVVLVQLPEGPRFFGNVEPLDDEQLVVGAPVEVVFTPPVDGVSVPRWRLDPSAAGDR